MTIELEMLARDHDGEEPYAGNPHVRFGEEFGALPQAYSVYVQDV